jgi:hypothetical protein
MCKMGGNFLSKCFTSSVTELGISCIAMGLITDEIEIEGSAICETLGKNDLAAAGVSPYKQIILGWPLEQQ